MKPLPINYYLRLMLLPAMLMLAGITSASEYYGIKVGGVPVRSDNWGSVTGSTIQRYDPSKPCYVRYYREYKMLTLENVKIVRTGSDNRAIYNESCDGLMVKFYGKNYLASESAAPVRLQASTTLWVSEDSVIIKGGSEDGIYITNQSVVDIIGDGPLKVEATSSSAIEGNNSSNRASVNFMGPHVELYGKEGSLVDLNVTFNKTYTNIDGETVKPISKVLLKASGKGSEPNIQNCPMTFYGTPATKILEPWEAYYSNNYIWLGNTAVYGYDILIGNHYKALITEDYFPNSKFREQLLNKFPKNYITDEDIALCKTLDLTGKGITDLTGIHYFTALEYLYCGMNYGLETLDVTSNTALKELDCHSDNMKTLNLGSNPNLKKLECYSNRLTSLNLTGCTGLTELSCEANELKTLNLSKNKALNTINLRSNKLTSLSLTNFSKLTALYCPDNQLNSLDLSGCSELQNLDCHSNSFTQLNISNLPKLTNLNCSNCQQLKTLDCYENPMLSSLLMSGLTSLETFDCHACALTSLSIPNTTTLRRVVCYKNKIQGTEMDNLVQALKNREGREAGQFVVMYNAGGEQNVCTEEQAEVATRKNWNVTYDNGQPIYDNSTPTAVETFSMQQQTQPAYNLAGQRVNSGYKGIIIRNGKKLRQ